MPRCIGGAFKCLNFQGVTLLLICGLLPVGNVTLPTHGIAATKAF